MTSSKQVQASIGYSPDSIRGEDDFYPSPPIAVEKLLLVEQFDGLIWEPACGDGAISEVLIEHGHDVRSSDKYDWGYGLTGIDFLADNGVSSVENIITNSPYQWGQKFVERAFELTTRKVAMLFRLAFLESQERKPMFESIPPARVWVFSKRLPRMHKFGYEGKKSTSMIAFAWFVWDHHYQGPSILGWL